MKLADTVVKDDDRWPRIRSADKLMELANGLSCSRVLLSGFRLDTQGRKKEVCLQWLNQWLLCDEL